MSGPQIFHRCPSCGASIRERAFFCPECGHQLEDQKNVDTEIVSATTAARESAPETSSQTESTSPATAVISAQEAKQGAEVNRSDYRGGRGQSMQGGRKVDGRHVRRTAEGEFGQRVERIRRISSEVLDQAAYDPSLRFILVAVFLFVLFLVILFLSKFIR